MTSFVVYLNTWVLTDLRLAESALACQKADVAWMEAVSMQRLDMLDRLHPSRFFYGSVGSLTGQLVSIIPHSEEILLESESDFFVYAKK